MFKITINLLVLIIFLNITSCNKNKPIKEYYKSGELKEEYYLDSDSMYHNIYRFFSKEGIILKEVRYNHGAYNGFYIERYNNNNLRKKFSFEEGLKNGKYEEYYSKGNIKEKGLIRNDTLLYCFYYNNKGEIIDVYRKIDFKTKSKEIFMNDTLNIHTYLNGPVNNNEIQGNIRVEYPFGMVKHYFYKVDSISKEGNTRIVLGYPGEYSIIALNKIIGEVGNHNYGEVLNINVKLDSNSFEEGLSKIKVNDTIMSAVKFKVLENGKYFDLYYDYYNKKYLNNNAVSD